MLLFVNFCLFLLFEFGVGQNCHPPGYFCTDKESCCGGCCVNQVCVDTYDDCTTLEDPCYAYYCPGDSYCTLYQPDCAGCQAEMQCVFLPEVQGNKTNSTLRNDTYNGGQNKVIALNVIVTTIMVYLL